MTVSRWSGSDSTYLRVTYLRVALRLGRADVKAIQQQLGHCNATVTLNTYTHLFEGDLAEVMDRLEVHSATCQVSVPARQVGSGTYTTLPRRLGGGVAAAGPAAAVSESAVFLGGVVFGSVGT